MKKLKIISIGIPCFNEELNVSYCYKELSIIASKLNNYIFEFIFVDNGSKDSTKNEIIKLAKKDKRVKGIFLSRNFGPESSGHAALRHARGEAFVMYECDLQDPPQLIIDFIKKWEEGYKAIVGVRNKIDDNIIMTVLRKSYYRLFKSISNIDVPVNAGSFCLIDRKVMNAILQVPEKYRFFRGLRAWVGFKTAYILYDRRKRIRGKSSYRFIDYIRHAERSFFGFSYFFLDIIIYIGIFLVMISFIFIVVYLFSSLVKKTVLDGSVTLLLVIVFFGGVQLLAVSAIGKYIQVIVEETKNRPVYIVDEVINTK